MDKLKKLEEILKKIEAYETLGGDVPTSKEVADVFAMLMEAMKKLHEAHTEQMEEMEREMSESEKEMLSKMDEQMSKMEKMCEEMMKAHGLEHEEMRRNIMAEIRGVMEMMPDLSVLEGKVSDIEKKIPKIPEELSPEIIRNKLETLEGDDRLDKKAVKGLDEAFKDIERKIPSRTIGGGARGIQLYTNGTKRGMAQMVNIIPGIGVSLTYDYASGRNDITINASASTSVLTATGTIDDSNMTFTFTSEPAILIINGASYRQAGGSMTWTYLAGTVTLSSPVGSGGSIFGLA